MEHQVNNVDAQQQQQQHESNISSSEKSVIYVSEINPMTLHLRTIRPVRGRRDRRWRATQERARRESAGRKLSKATFEKSGPETYRPAAERVRS